MKLSTHFIIYCKPIILLWINYNRNCIVELHNRNGWEFGGNYYFTEKNFKRLLYTKAQPNFVCFLIRFRTIFYALYCDVASINSYRKPSRIYYLPTTDWSTTAQKVRFLFSPFKIIDVKKKFFRISRSVDIDGTMVI